MKNLIRLTVRMCAATFLLAMTAEAAPVTWSINNAVYTDGSSITGTFDYDAVTGTYSNDQVTVVTYFPLIEFDSFTGEPDIDLTGISRIQHSTGISANIVSGEPNFQFDDDGPFILIHDGYLITFDDNGSQFNLANAPTAAGGIIPIIGENFVETTVQEIQCVSAPCGGFAPPVHFSFYNHSYPKQLVSGIDSVSPVPVPAAAWLFGSALLGLVGIVRKRA